MFARRTIVCTILLAALAPLALACSGDKSEAKFPSYVYASALSLESYKAALALSESVTTQIPCYCGCADLPTPHRHLRDCFINPDGSFTDHASGCDLCGKIVLDVQEMHRKGVSLKEVRAAIDAKYSVYGNPTDTPKVAN